MVTDTYYKSRSTGRYFEVRAWRPIEHPPLGEVVRAVEVQIPEDFYSVPGWRSPGMEEWGTKGDRIFVQVADLEAVCDSCAEGFAECECD